MSTGEPEKYLAVLKASYDYAPQSDDEIAIKEEQLLLLVEKVDDDWWRVKITGNAEDIANQIGLVPAAYVEQAPHTSIVKAVYDYEATAPGELSVHEDDVLYMFYNEEDWILVQDSTTEGRAGYVPGNYVEVIDGEDPKPVPPAPTRIIVPDSPPKPAYVDPADRVASTKVTADDIKTWSVSEIDKKGKKKKGTLGIGNGSLFFASESDKTPVQKWQTKDVTTVSSEKAKHVQIDIGGPNPTSLHFHAGSKENTDAIQEKLQTSRALSSEESENLSLLSAPSPAKKPSVHFSPAAPTIIPGPEEPEEEQVIQDEEHNIQDEEEQDMATALYDFNADGEDELTVKEGENLTVLERDGEEWWKCRNAKGLEGVVPASYLEAITGTHAKASKENDRFEDDEAETRRAEEEEEEAQRRRDAERLQREQEEDHRRAEAAATAVKEEAQRKAKESAAAAQAERQRRKEAAAARAASPPVVQPPSRTESSRPSSSSNSRVSTDVNRPPSDQTRTWHDRTGQFRVEAAFLGFSDGKLRLHKVNGVIVEVPSEKMSLDDMRYVEKVTEKKKRPSNVNPISDDDIPLAITKNSAKSQRQSSPHKKGPQIDWFDFFLSAGCDLDDCTRYAAAFEKDKMDVTLLNDTTEGTMRSLGLREGDIIRVKKAIEKRKPTDSLHKPSAHLQEQIHRDEELARQLQAQENANGGRTSAPNLFAGPGGVLKPRRGRPQTSKSLPPTNVDLNAISSASGQIRRTESPISSGIHATALPARSGSALAPVVDGFDDDAWTNRPSSAKPVKSASPSPAIAASSQPLANSTAQLETKLPAPTPTSHPQPTPTSVPATVSAPVQNQNSQSGLARTTEADILDQLARLSDLRKNSGSQMIPQTSALQPSSALSSGMPMGSSPLPMGQVANSRLLSPPPAQPYNGPRGPYAPVPANQGLLRPLIPTQTGFNGFIPTKSSGLQSPFQNQLSATSFLQTQPTGFQNPSPIMAQPTGAFGNFGGAPFQGNSGLGSITGVPIQAQATSFPQLNQSLFANGNATAPPPPNVMKDTSPASVFAQMKSGTFAKDDIPSAGVGQTPNWLYQGYTGY